MDISLAGRLVLLAALMSSFWTSFASAGSVWRRSVRLADSGRRALCATGILVAFAAVLLVVALYSRDFSLAYVAGYSSRSTPPLHTFTALWAGMEGSLLFWTLITCLWAGTAVARLNLRQRDLAGTATAVLGAILTFFLGIVAFAANPFEPISPTPIDGSGLNPLLQSPFMAIHPVLLYLGFTGFAVPFAFAVAALVAGRLDVSWFTSTRRWTVLAWSFLTAGIALGAAWAYMELGWGGFWAWDPVENASLLPWLTGTAFLHSVLVQERRGMLKIWNVGLILATYSLAILGTFLTRSGLLSSVHTFSESPTGKMFLPFLAVMVVAAFGLLGWRYEKLRSHRHLESMLCRESMFLFNNLLLTTIAFTVLWGTVYPIIVEAVSGAKISVGPPFFNAVVVPVGIALLGLTGIGPLVTWRRSSWLSLKRQLQLPLAAGAATVIALAAGAGVTSTGALFGLGLSAFVATATLGEFVRGARGHRGRGRFGLLKGLVEVIARNRRRYGGYIVHLGVVLICLGLSGTAFKQSWSGSLSPGQSFNIGGYSIRYDHPRAYSTPEKVVRMAVMTVRRDGDVVARLTPQRNLHLASNQPQSEIGLKSSLADDLYLVLTQIDLSGTVTMRAWVNPLVAWIWVGAVVMILGTLVIMSAVGPRPGRRRAPTLATKPRERVSVPTGAS
jgi:cytochrome c-type biogenesis protein CcmF